MATYPNSLFQINNNNNNTNNCCFFGNYNHPNHNKNNSTTAAAAFPSDVLSTKLNQLSMEERTNALNDLHGVSTDQIQPENPEFLESKIQEMTERLKTIVQNSATTTTTKQQRRQEQHNHHINNEEQQQQQVSNTTTTTTTTSITTSTKAFQMAMATSPEYVENLKLRFLRGTRFDTKRAAEIMIRFFQLKLVQFGKELLVRDVQFEDLGSTEQELLQNGLIQLLPKQDSAGRPITFFNGIVSGACPDTNAVIRAIFYFTMATLQDVQSQQRGCVTIYYGVGQTKTVPGRPQAFLTTWEAMPGWVVSLHHCKDRMSNLSTVFGRVINLLCHALQNWMLCRARFHDGTHMECIYTLMTFGIPRDTIPVRNDGSMDLTHHTKMLQCLKNRENKQVRIQQQQQQLLKQQAGANENSVPSIQCISSSNSSSATTMATTTTTTTTTNINNTKMTLIPGRMDIPMGRRGKRPTTSDGSLLMHKFILDHREAYEAAPKFVKATIVKKIVQQLKEDAGCRFLNFIPGEGYMEGDDLTAQKKVAHVFRNLRIKDRKVIGEIGVGLEGNHSTTHDSSSNHNDNNNNNNILFSNNFAGI